MARLLGILSRRSLWLLVFDSVHEPECGSFPEGCCPWMPEPCDCQCTCDVLRSAYQRGREDAAQAVMNHVAPDNCLGDDCCAAAARGDGEQ